MLVLVQEGQDSQGGNDACPQISLPLGSVMYIVT